MSTSSKKNKLIPVLLIFGPTGVGKTEFLFKLQKKLKIKLHLNIEVISADSMQVYCGMDIGTAKPTLAERETLPHRLIDIAEPKDQFDLGDFVRESEKIVHELYSRNILPIISGGTAYYFKHYLYGLPSTPSVTDDIRIMVQQMHADYGNEKLMTILEKVDSKSAKRIHLNDSYRISRALEVYYATGKPLSSFTMDEQPRNDVSPLIIGLRRERKFLYERINARVEVMFENGLISEVEGLYEKGYRQDDPGMRGIGYREFFEYGWFQKQQRTEGDVLAVKKQIKTNSRRYAKRQLTFFSSLNNVQWFSPDEDEKIIKTIIEFIENKNLNP